MLGRSAATKSVVQSAIGAGSQSRSATTLGIGLSRPQPKVQPTKYGGVYSCTLLPGDGVGKEITQSVEEIFEVDHHPLYAIQLTDEPKS